MARPQNDTTQKSEIEINFKFDYNKNKAGRGAPLVSSF